MGLIDSEELARLAGAEALPERTPLPLRIVSSDEYLPSPQSARQREAGRRLESLADGIAPGLGLSRRRFFQTSAGMAAAFVAMNQTYGARLFAATRAEAANPGLADARAAGLKDQFVVDVHTHFVRNDFLPANMLGVPFPWRKAAKEFGWNPAMASVSFEAVQYANYFKEIYFDSDTKVALISSAPGATDNMTVLTNRQMAEARDKVNAAAGSRRMLSHGLFNPGKPGWLDELDEALALKPDSMKGYTIGAASRTGNGREWPWRMDSAEAYKGYERMAEAGVKIVCVHKGLFPLSMERRVPELRGYVDVSDVGQAAKDWPQLEFVIYHAGYRHADDPAGARRDPGQALAEFERSGRLSWVSELAEIPAQYGVSNVHADLGQVFALTLIAQPRICAAMLGILIRGLGASRVCWGTDAVWTGSPQWQIEGLRRLEIPADMRKRHGFARLGAAQGPVKSAILGGNSAKLYGLDANVRAGVLGDALAGSKRDYELAGREPSNMRYGYIAGVSA